jgi:hypothetical protein
VKPYVEMPCNDRDPAGAGAVQVGLEVVDEHPRHVRRLLVVDRRTGQLVDHQRAVADVELDPRVAVPGLGERVLALG